MAGPALRVEAASPLARSPSHQRGRVSSKADDFDVRYRDVRDGPGWDNGTEGGYSVTGHQVLANGEVPGGTVDYDLG